MNYRILPAAIFLTSLGLAAQEPQLTERPPDASGGWKRLDSPEKPGTVSVETGTRIPLSMINSISTKSAAEGDRVYLETVFPILVDGKITIPPGSYVSGTVTQVKRPGRIKGRAQLFVRFDSLTLPNGITRSFSGHVGGLDGRANEDLDRSEGTIKGGGNKGGDARTIGEAAATGAGVGAIAGAASGRPGRGLGIGGAAGAAAGMVGVLLTRGPDALLAKGTSVEMVLDRTLRFEEAELNFGPMTRRPVSDGGGPLPSQNTQERNRRFGGIF